MTEKTRKRRKLKIETINWVEVLGDKAWLAVEVAPRLGVAPLTCRRLLRMAYVVGSLDRQNKGRYKYYITSERYRKMIKRREEEAKKQTEDSSVSSPSSIETIV